MPVAEATVETGPIPELLARLDHRIISEFIEDLVASTGPRLR